MPYSEFTSIRKVQERFPDIQVEYRKNLFEKESQVSLELSVRLKLELEDVSLAAAVNTEKARSELIIAPVLLEVWRRFKRQIGFFSGKDFNVDASLGLSGFCDFILTRKYSPFEIVKPVLTVVEAKNESIPSGLGQCMAEMLAARLFNGDRQLIFGSVTIGTEWKFLKLHDQTVWIDEDLYYIDRPEKIVAILSIPFQQSSNSSNK